MSPPPPPPPLALLQSIDSVGRNESRGKRAVWNNDNASFVQLIGPIVDRNKHWRGIVPSDRVIVNYEQLWRGEFVEKKKKERRRNCFLKEGTNISNISFCMHKSKYISNIEFIYLTRWLTFRGRGIFNQNLEINSKRVRRRCQTSKLDRNSPRLDFSV